MQITGIICEYNPLHLGHSKQLSLLKARDKAVVCLMSGNFVQRGEPAVFCKMLRAQAALDCGADLVLELPATYSLRSAEGFAAGGVEILSPICHELSFGAESANGDALMALAQALLSEQFQAVLPQFLDRGLSFAAARQKALEQMGLNASILETPNNILAVEYCKAILAQNAELEIAPIARGGSYHDTLPDPENPSATSLRLALERGQSVSRYLPPAAAAAFENAPRHTLAQGEKAMLAVLRTMPEEAFSALPFGGEGLWRKFMYACRTESSLPEILAAAKSKRYAYSRLSRMAMCAFLGLTEADLAAKAPYVRILGFNDTGRAILRQALDRGIPLVNIGTPMEGAYARQEERVGALYGLFAPTPEPPNREQKMRVLRR